MSFASTSLVPRLAAYANTPQNFGTLLHLLPLITIDFGDKIKSAKSNINKTTKLEESSLV